MAAAWFYMQDGKRVGPVSVEQLRELASRGGLRREDTVWTIGMNQWAPAGQVPAVFGADAAPAPALPGATGAAPVYAAPVSAPTAAPTQPAAAYAAPAPVSYFDGGLPPRAAANLRGHAPPTGDTGDWPVDDVRVIQFADAMKIRRKVTGAAQLYRALLFLAIIALVIFLVIGVLAFAGGTGGGAAAGAGMLVAGAFLGAFALLYYFTWRATMRAHRWAPLTMLILFSCGVALNLVQLGTAASGNRPEMMMGAVLGMILPAIFAVVSWTSFAAIPKWRAQPAWCQELIVKAGL